MNTWHMCYSALLVTESSRRFSSMPRLNPQGCQRKKEMKGREGRGEMGREMKEGRRRKKTYDKTGVEPSSHRLVTSGHCSQAVWF